MSVYIYTVFKNLHMSSIYICVCAYFHLFSYLFMYFLIGSYEYMSIYIYICVYIPICLFIHLFTYTYIYVYMYKLYLYIYMCVCVCVSACRFRATNVCSKLAPSVANLPLTCRIWELIWCDPKLFVFHGLTWFIHVYSL